MADLNTIAQTCLAARVRRSSRALTRRYDRALAPLDLRITQFSVLVAAGLAREDMSITDLAETLGLERSSLSRNLAPLERRGLIALGPERQHRARSIQLTDAGRLLLDRAIPVWESVQAETKALLHGEFDMAVKSLKQLSQLV
ncbi:MAG: MarR family winged helix-turn-helix transcriptional regulator [Candidatus Competibacterales bacterium]